MCEGRCAPPHKVKVKNYTIRNLKKRKTKIYCKIWAKIKKIEKSKMARRQIACVNGHFLWNI